MRLLNLDRIYISLKIRRIPMIRKNATTKRKTSSTAKANSASVAARKKTTTKTITTKKPTRKYSPKAQDEVKKGAKVPKKNKK